MWNASLRSGIGSYTVELKYLPSYSNGSSSVQSLVIRSIDSFIRSRGLPVPGAMPNTPDSSGEPPDPIPKKNRPLARWSSMAMRWATITGL